MSIVMRSELIFRLMGFLSKGIKGEIQSEKVKRGKISRRNEKENQEKREKVEKIFKYFRKIGEKRREKERKFKFEIKERKIE